jgi:DNA-binding PadR family transcriptional regulator
MVEEYRNLIIKRLTKSFLDMQLLRLISKEMIWGYKIKKMVENELGIKLRHSALYPALNDLERQGLVTSQKQKKDGRSRKVYILTPKGKLFLNTYLAVLREQSEQG